MATETNERSLCYVETEAVNWPDRLDRPGEYDVHLCLTEGRLGWRRDVALCGLVILPARDRRVAYVQVEGDKTAISKATCDACIAAAEAVGGKVPVGS